MSFTVEPMDIHVADTTLGDLRARLRATRWPDQIPGIGWEQGTDQDALRQLVSYWADAFDWRTSERELNALSHFRADIDDLSIHFVHEKAKHGGGIPIVLTHGWPGTFLEELSLLPRLTDPTAYGIEGPAFDVVIASLPGFPFSSRPRRVGITPRVTAGIWLRLMRGLGYDQFVAHGSDFGARVTTYLGMDYPEHLLGVHLTALDEPSPYLGPGSRPLSDAERQYIQAINAWLRAEYGYGEIQSTKPQTVGYGLNDSPAGLAAWMLEKWRSMGDTDGDVVARFGRDFLLANFTLYWATQTVTSSMRYYYDNHHFGGATGSIDFVSVPTGIALFPNQYMDAGTPPREYGERLYNISHWTESARGAHFPAAEEPDLLARDIAAFCSTGLRLPG